MNLYIPVEAFFAVMVKLFLLIYALEFGYSLYEFLANREVLT